MYAERHTVELTTNASGNATGHTPMVTGCVLAIHYAADGTSPFDNTVDFTITAEQTGETIWTESNLSASKSVYPRPGVQHTDGTDALYAAGGTKVRDGAIALAQDRVKIVIAQGGNAKKGKFHVVIG